MQKFKDIVERTELVRTKLRLNKSQFSARIGISPQTYNNFTGNQGSKPNMELFHGVVSEFGVNPMWLLSGTGEPFASPPAMIETAGEGPRAPRQDSPARFKHNADTLRRLRKELETVLSGYRGRATPLLNSGVQADPQIHLAIQVLIQVFRISPVETAAAIMQLLDRLSILSEEIAWLNSNREKTDAMT